MRIYDFFRLTCKIPWACNQLTYALILLSLSLQSEKKKDLSGIEDITFAMRNRQEWFNEKMAAVSPEIVSEVQLSADIIARLDAILGLSCTCMNNNSNNS
jgi:hypothetical protein